MKKKSPLCFRLHGLEFIIAIIMTGLTFVGAYYLLPHEHYLYIFLFERSYIQHLSVFLFWWAIGDLLRHYIVFSFQRRAAKRVIQLLSQPIYASKVPLLKEELDRHMPYMAAERFNSVLEYIKESKPTRDEILNYLRTKSESAESSLVTSYQTIRVMVFLIPLSGFLGTVIGMSQAITQFGGLLDKYSSAGTILQHLQGPLSGLGVAFDTTVLAIILAMGLHVFATALRKREERLLSDIDGAGESTLFLNLRLPGLAQNLESRMKEISEESVQRYQQLLSQVENSFASLGKSSQQLAENVNSFAEGARILTNFEKMLRELHLLNIHIQQMVGQGEQLSERTTSIADKVAALPQIEEILKKDGEGTAKAFSGLREDLKLIRSAVHDATEGEIVVTRKVSKKYKNLSDDIALFKKPIPGPEGNEGT